MHGIHSQDMCDKMISPLKREWQIWAWWKVGNKGKGFELFGPNWPMAVTRDEIINPA